MLLFAAVPFYSANFVERENIITHIREGNITGKEEKKMRGKRREM